MTARNKERKIDESPNKRLKRRKEGRMEGRRKKERKKGKKKRIKTKMMIITVRDGMGLKIHGVKTSWSIISVMPDYIQIG